MLASIAGLIERTRPFIRAEVFKFSTPGQRTGLHEFFTSRNYDVLQLIGETDYRGQHLSAADMTRWAHFDVFAVPR